MKEIEDLLSEERATELPAPPDPKYTRSAVLRRLNRHEPPGADAADLLPGAAALVLLVMLGSGLYMLDQTRWLLALVPLGAVSLCPLLLEKGGSR